LAFFSPRDMRAVGKDAASIAVGAVEGGEAAAPRTCALTSSPTRGKARLNVGRAGRTREPRKVGRSRRG
jgi:hypothetical protein